MSELIMKIKAGELYIPIKTNIGRNEPIDDIRREIIDVITTSPLTQEQIVALQENDWEMYWDDTLQGTQVGYSEIVEYHTWFARPKGNDELVQELQQDKQFLIQQKSVLLEEKEILTTEKEALTTEKVALTNNVRTMRTAAQTFLDNRDDDVLIQLLDLMDEWRLYQEEGENVPSNYTRGQSRKHEGHPYTCIQSHSTDGDANRAPNIAQALWAVYHAKSAQYALPWAAPTHAEDIYKTGEFMIWTDEAIYECLENTDRAPDVLPNKWRKVDAQGNPIEGGGGGGEPDPEDPPTEQNSNGTAVWSEWRPWTSGLNSDLYQIGDRVTLDGVRYVATLNGNHWSPASGTGWTVAPE